jgi:hypothetical protein
MAAKHVYHRQQSTCVLFGKANPVTHRFAGLESAFKAYDKKFKNFYFDPIRIRLSILMLGSRSAS